VYLTWLELEGHELRRPYGDYLRDGIYELRTSLGGVHYRILYFFQGIEAVVVSHGLTKERSVPGVEIERAIRRMKQFRSDPPSHTFVPAKGE
jgi:phage-related protein